MTSSKEGGAWPTMTVDDSSSEYALGRTEARGMGKASLLIPSLDPLEHLELDNVMLGKSHTENCTDM